MSRGLFITATDTDAGKTFVTALITKALREKGLNAGYYKAALSGAYYEEGTLIPGDAKEVLETSGLEDTYERCVSYTFETPVSPHLAAQIEGIEISLDKIKSDYETICKDYDFVSVEGSGGIICPIKVTDSEVILLEDLIKLLGLSVLIVARAALGTINHTVLTAKYIQSLSIPIKGIILNEYEEGNKLHEDNKRIIERLTGIQVVATIPRMENQIDQSKLNLDKLITLYE